MAEDAPAADFPAPPHRSDEQECARFDALQARLVSLWGHVFPADDEPYTSVVVPSLDPGAGLPVHGGTYMEERLLFLMIRLRNPFARLVYVTSQPIHPLVIEYYLMLLAGTPASHAQARLTLLSVHDSSPRPLSEKLLERPRLLQRVRAAIRDPERAYLTVPHSTPMERKLALALGIPLNGPDPRLMSLGTKSRARRLLREAGLSVPAGAEDLRSERDLAAALEDLRRRRPGLRAAVIKIDDGYAGEANAVFSYPPNGDVRGALRSLRPSSPGRTAEEFVEVFARTGGVAEELLEGAEVSSPSVQVRINPHGKVFVTSTHEQLLGGPVGQIFHGCEFPASSTYRGYLQDAGLAAGRLLAQRGIVGRVSVDFVAVGGSGDQPSAPVAVDLNLRMGGTTHPMLALRFLTGGRYDPSTGLFHDPQGRPKFYTATDHLESAAYRRLVPEDVIDILTLHHLGYDHRSMSGVVFHMLGGVSEYGRLGLVAIGDSRQQARGLYLRAIEVLDREAALPAT